MRTLKLVVAIIAGTGFAEVMMWIARFVDEGIGLVTEAQAGGIVFWALVTVSVPTASWIGVAVARRALATDMKYGWRAKVGQLCAGMLAVFVFIAALYLLPAVTFSVFAKLMPVEHLPVCHIWLPMFVTVMIVAAQFYSQRLHRAQ